VTPDLVFNVLNNFDALRRGPSIVAERAYHDAVDRLLGPMRVFLRHMTETSPMRVELLFPFTSSGTEDAFLPIPPDWADVAFFGGIS
jgi:hypothetical protein